MLCGAIGLRSCCTVRVRADVLGGAVQEVSAALQRSEAQQAHLRETLVRTEALIKQAKLEHEQDLQEAGAAARAELEAAQRHCRDLQLAVRPPDPHDPPHRVIPLGVAPGMSSVCAVIGHAWPVRSGVGVAMLRGSGTDTDSCVCLRLCSRVLLMLSWWWFHDHA